MVGYAAGQRSAKTLSWYLDRIKERTGIETDRALARAIRVTNATLIQYRRGAARPLDERMLIIADLAGVPRDQAMLDLVMSKTDDDDVLSTWELIKQRIVAAVIVGTLGVVMPAPVDAGTLPQHPAVKIATAIYYHKSRWALIGRAFRKLAAGYQRSIKAARSTLRTALYVGGNRVTGPRSNPAWLAGRCRAAPATALV